MKKEFTVERYSLEEELAPLNVTLEVPDEIVMYLQKVESNFDTTYVDTLVSHLENYFRYASLYKEPSFESQKPDKLEIAAYRVHPKHDPFESLKESLGVGQTQEIKSGIEIKPKFEPKWIETDHSHSGIGFTNQVTTLEMEDLDFITAFTMDAFTYFH